MAKPERRKLVLDLKIVRSLFIRWFVLCSFVFFFFFWGGGGGRVVWISGC